MTVFVIDHPQAAEIIIDNAVSEVPGNTRVGALETRMSLKYVTALRIDATQILTLSVNFSDFQDFRLLCITYGLACQLLCLWVRVRW